MKSVGFDYRLETANNYMSKYVCISCSFNFFCNFFCNYLICFFKPVKFELELTRSIIMW